MNFPDEYEDTTMGQFTTKTAVEQIIPTTDPDGYIVKIDTESTVIATGSVDVQSRHMFFPQAIIDYIKNTVLA